MLISEVRHQSRARRIVERARNSGRVPHAYIFHGPGGVGRETFARALAGELLGGASDAADDHPDLHLIHRELIRQHPDPEVRKRKGLILGIDVIRHFVIHAVASKPVMGIAKVFIIREAEKMNIAAQNALLKTLEEPPATTFLILIAASLDKLLPTVRSRCQLVPFGLLPAEFVVEKLREIHPDIADDEARACAAHACGSVGVALRHHEDHLIDFGGRLAEATDALRGSNVSDVAKRWIECAKELAESHRRRDPDISETEAQRRGLKALLGLMGMALRERLLQSVGAPSDSSGGCVEMAGGLSPRRAAEAIRGVVTTERQLDANANAQLCVEGFLIRLSRLCAER